MTSENREQNQSKLFHEVWCVHKFSSEPKIDEKLAEKLREKLGQDADKFFPVGASMSQILVKYGQLERKNTATINLCQDKTSSNNNNLEPWASRWIAAPIGYLCSKEQREEWLGDLYEVIHEMQSKSYPRWMINLICMGKTVILIFSAFEIKISDFLALLKKS